MIQFEIAFLMFLAVVSVVAIAAVGRPVAEVYAEKLKARYRQMSPDLERALSGRVSALEGELLEMRRELSSVRETADFAMRFVAVSC
jgi:hypothetical protein